MQRGAMHHSFRCLRIRALTGCLLGILFVSGCAVKLVLGASVARTIDIQLGPAFFVPNLGLRVGRAVCPTTINLSNGKAGRCTLPLSGVPVPIHVKPVAQFVTYVVAIEHSVIPMRSVEQYEESELLAGYDLRAEVLCGNPRVRIAEIGRHVRCSLQGSRLPANHIDLKILDNAGHVLFYNSPLRKSRTTILIDRYLSLHQARQPTIVPGIILASYIRRHAIQLTQDLELRKHIGRASCPMRSDLSGNRKTRCTLRVAQFDVPYSVWIDGSGNFQVSPQAFIG